MSGGAPFRPRAAPADDRGGRRCAANVPLDRYTGALAAVGALAAILVLLRVSALGAGLTPDSTAYVSVARNLLDGRWFALWNGDAFRDHTPLFPMALAVPGLFGVDAVKTAGYVNAAAFGLTAFAAGAWVRSRTASRALALWAAAACALSLSLAEAAAFAWSDSLFVLLVCLALFALDRYLEGGRRPLLLAAAVCAALACLARYAGLSLIASALLLLLLPAGGRRPAAPLRRAGDAAAFLIVAAGPIGAWMLRNVLEAGSATGIAWGTDFSLLNSLHLAGSELALWTLGPRGVDALDAAAGAAAGVDIDGDPSVAGVAVLIAVLLALAVAAWGALLRLRRGGAPVRPGAAAAFALVYALGLAAVLPRTDVDLTARYLAPLYVPVLVAASSVPGELLRRASERCPAAGLPLPPGSPGAGISRPALILTACLALWLAQWIGPNHDDIRGWRERGAGYSAREWKESDTVRSLRSRPPAGQIWSNEARALYLLADIREGLREMPSGALPDDADSWVAWAHVYHGGQEAWLVWFHARSWRRHGFGVAELAALRGWQEAAVLEDGVVLRGDWDAGGETARLGGDALLRAALRGARPVARGRFDVYADGERLVYVRDACGAGDEDPRFFLHVTPADADDLPGGRGRSGFENLDFDFAGHGFRHAGRCIAVRNLPRYGIARIATGQWTRSERRIWEAEFAPAGDERAGAPRPAATATGTPARGG